jgi:predicted amidophosphoribosyltransferase
VGRPTEPDFPGTLLCENCGALLPADYVLPVGISGGSKLLCEECVRRLNAEYMECSDYLEDPD